MGPLFVRVKTCDAPPGLVGFKQLAMFTGVPFAGVPCTVTQRLGLVFHLICERPVGVDEALDEDEDEVGPPPTNHTTFLSATDSRVRPTLIGITRGALVGLRSIVPFIQTLVAASYSDSVVGSQVPSTMMSEDNLVASLTSAGVHPGTKSKLLLVHYCGDRDRHRGRI